MIADTSKKLRQGLITAAQAELTDAEYKAMIDSSDPRAYLIDVKLMPIITAALETQDEQSRIDELEKLDIDQAHNWSPLLTSAGQRHINARITQLRTEKKKRRP